MCVDYDFGNEKNFVELETTTARDVGRPVSIWWDEEAEAFDGVIESFEPGKGWFIVYDDGDEEWNAGPVRVRFRDREPQEKVLKQKLQKVGQSNSSPKREDTTQALTQPASHHKFPCISPPHLTLYLSVSCRRERGRALQPGTACARVRLNLLRRKVPKPARHGAQRAQVVSDERPHSRNSISLLPRVLVGLWLSLARRFVVSYPVLQVYTGLVEHKLL